MAYRFRYSQQFDRQMKNLAKHNPHLRSDLAEFLDTFDADLYPVIPGTTGARKARMKISGRGKSGGYRVIYYVHIGDRVWLLHVYDKVHRENLSNAEIQRIVTLIQEIKMADKE